MEDDRDGQQTAGNESREDESESDSDASSSGGDKSSENECNNTMLTGGMKFKSQQDFEAFLNSSKSSEDESEDDSDEEEIGRSINIRQMLA